MCKNWLIKIAVLPGLSFVVLFGQIYAQTSNPTTKVNFGYSQNPKTKIRKETVAANKVAITPAGDLNTLENSQAEKREEKTTPEINSTVKTDSDNRSIAQKTFEIAKKANIASLAPTEIYKVGVGDILFINLQNAASKSANYFTVLNDGTIDYPLAGESVSVSGLTTDEVEELLNEKIKLFENPRVSVKIREFASHAVTVLGLVEKAGEKYLQREAVPLYVVRAEAIVQPTADSVVIKRADSSTEKFDLKDPKNEGILVFPGDIVEFTSVEKNTEKASKNSEYYYIGGNIVSPGQKDFHAQITLTQAILASGGMKKSNSKKAYIRRKNSSNLLVTFVYNLKDIKDGKSPDPILQAGDIIEIEN